MMGGFWQWASKRYPMLLATAVAGVVSALANFAYIVWSLVS